MKRIISIMLASTLILGSLAGCKKEDQDPLMELSKEELVNMANANMAQMQTDADRISELETLLKGIQEEKEPTPGISVIDDGTGRLTFTTVNGVIQFPTELIYPNSEQAPNTGSVSITQSINISPTGNWVLNLDGTTLQLNHPTGVVGVIKAGKISDVYPRNKIQEDVFGPFFENFPPETIQYSKLFIDDNWWGLQAVTPTTVDEEPAQIRCGVFGMAETCFVYVFIYKGDKDTTKDELELSLLRTMRIYNNPLRIEQ